MTTLYTDYLPLRDTNTVVVPVLCRSRCLLYRDYGYDDALKCVFALTVHSFTVIGGVATVIMILIDDDSVAFEAWHSIVITFENDNTHICSNSI